MACLVGDPNGMCPLDGTLSAYGDYGPDELTKDLTGTSNSSDNGSFSFGAFSFVAGEAISPTEGGFGAAESIPIAGWDSSDGLFQSSLDALGGGVGTHSDNFSFFGATGPTSGGPLEIAGFQEANVGPDNGLFGMAVGGGIFETNNNGLGIYGHIGVTSLGENAYVGVGGLC